MNIKDEFKKLEVDALPVRYEPNTAYLKPGLKIEEWAKMGREMLFIREGINWWLGDWLVYGESQYGDLMWQYVEQAFTIKTINTIKYVCSQLAPEMRHPRLSFSHHIEVVYKLPPDLRESYLQIAENNGMTRNELREKILKDVGEIRKNPRLTDRQAEIAIKAKKLELLDKFLSEINPLEANYTADLAVKLKEEIENLYESVNQRKRHPHTETDIGEG